MDSIHEILERYGLLLNKLLSSNAYSFSLVSPEQVPREPGVYVILTATTDSIIYVGRSKNLRRRLLSDHRLGNIEGSQFRKALQRKFGLESEAKVSEYIRTNCSFKFITIRDPSEMVRFEHFTTAAVGPALNIELAQQEDPADSETQ